MANSLNDLGLVLRDLGDVPSARSCLTESLALSRELGDPTSLAFLLEFFSLVAAQEQQPRSALQLAGAAGSLRESLRAPLSPAEHARWQSRLDPACWGLDPAERDGLLTASRQLGVEDAIHLALHGRAAS